MEKRSKSFIWRESMTAWQLKRAALQAQAAGPGAVQRGGSVPGRVRQTPGGVARNIAHSLALLCGPCQVPARLARGIISWAVCWKLTTCTCALSCPVHRAAGLPRRPFW